VRAARDSTLTATLMATMGDPNPNFARVVRPSSRCDSSLAHLSRPYVEKDPRKMRLSRRRVRRATAVDESAPRSTFDGGRAQALVAHRARLHGRLAGAHIVLPKLLNGSWKEGESWSESGGQDEASASRHIEVVDFSLESLCYAGGKTLTTTQIWKHP
jgi:hypothetical protein